jgi:hypothetical protein
MNNPLSFSSVKLDLFTKDGTRLKSASGFMVEAGDRYYLITNWHVLSGRDITSHGPDGPGVEPFILKTSLHIFGGDGENSFPLSWGQWKRITAQLYDENDAPAWIERRAEKGGQSLVDVVALPIQVNQDLKFNQALRQFGQKMGGTNMYTGYWARISAIPISSADTDVDYGPPDTVYIVGYPHDWAPAGRDKSSPAFWRTSSIAAEIDEADLTRADTFFIDPPAPVGMTGSPVVGMKDGRTKLLGVYSERSMAGYAADAGLVWDASLLKELIGPS